MRKWWLGLSVLVGVIAYLSLNLTYFSPSPEKKSTELTPVTTSPKTKLPIAYPPSDPQEPAIPSVPLSEIQPARASFPAKQSSRLPRVSANEVLPEVFWGYIKLVGITFLGHNHHLNKAIIEDLITSQQAHYSLDGLLPYGAKLVQVLKDRIILEKNGVKRTLMLYDSLDNAAKRKAFLARGYQMVAQNEWLIRPNRLLRNNERIKSILGEANIVPYLSADEVQGFQVNKLKRGSLIKELGIKEGDVIARVNGEEIGGLKNALLTYWRVRKSPLINVSIERNQQPVNLSYRIIPDGPPGYSIEDVFQVPDIAGLFASIRNSQ